MNIDNKRLTIGLFILMLSMISLICCSRQQEQLSTDILGLWQSSCPRYKDRFLLISSDSVTFEFGGGEKATYPITRVRKRVKKQRTEYSLTYRNDENLEIDLNFYLYPRGDGVIIFKNQPEVKWLRVGSN